MLDLHLIDFTLAQEYFLILCFNMIWLNTGEETVNNNNSMDNLCSVGHKISGAFYAKRIEIFLSVTSEIRTN